MLVPTFPKKTIIPSFYALVEAEILGFVAGAGKSVLWYVKRLMFLPMEPIVFPSSTIIEDIDAIRKTGQASLAFFYFDFREDQKKDLRVLLSSFPSQLCHQSDSSCRILSQFHSSTVTQPTPPPDPAPLRP